MHFVDAWTDLAPIDLLLLLAAPAIAIIAMLLPGRAVARTASLALALLGPALPGFGPPLLRLGWVALWFGVAMVSGLRRDAPPIGEPGPPGGVESGSVGLASAAVLFVLLVVALGRQDLSPELTRPAAVGLLLMAAGIAHLMLRRDAMRGAMSFATIGLGLQWLDRAARGVVLEANDVPPGTVLIATVIAAALAARVALVRQQDAGSAWVSHAHDLHD